MRRLAAATALLLVMLTPAFGGADAIDRASRTIAMRDGSTAVRVDATIADLTIAASDDRRDVRIDVERRAPTRADLARLPVSIDESADGIHVALVQDDGARDPRVGAAISIAAPRSATFPSVRVFEGRVRISNVDTAADVQIRRGTIDAARLAGRVRLDSELGGIDVRDSELTAGGMMRLRVFNGPVRIRFGRQPSNARILAVTLNGRITSDIPLTVKDRFGPRFGETTIGSGEPVMSVDVVKGDISISVGSAGGAGRAGGAGAGR